LASGFQKKSLLKHTLSYLVMGRSSRDEGQVTGYFGRRDHPVGFFVGSLQHAIYRGLQGERWSARQSGGRQKTNPWDGPLGMRLEDGVLGRKWRLRACPQKSMGDESVKAKGAKPKQPKGYSL
jgi:hypothetical protein